MPRRKTESFMMKWRVKPTRPMSVRDLRSLLMQAIRTRYVPEGIEIVQLDWAHGTAASYKRGDTIDGSDLDSLGDFASAMRKAGRGLRVERV